MLTSADGNVIPLRYFELVAKDIAAGRKEQDVFARWRDARLDWYRRYFEDDPVFQSSKGKNTAGHLATLPIPLDDPFTGIDDDAFSGITGTTQRTTKKAKTPKVRVGEPLVEDGVDAANVKKTLMKYHRDLNDCYGKAIEEEGREFEGAMKLRLTTSKDGSVYVGMPSARFMGHTALALCLNIAITQWRFPENPGSFAVPLSFELK